MVKAKKSAGEKVFDIVNCTVMAILIFATVYPFWYVIVGSFNEGLDFNKGGIYFWPREWSFANYEKVFQNDDLVNALFITVSRTVIGVVTHTLFTGLFAFGFYRKDLVFKRFYWIIWIYMIIMKKRLNLILITVLLTQYLYQEQYVKIYH